MTRMGRFSEGINYLFQEPMDHGTHSEFVICSVNCYILTSGSTSSAISSKLNLVVQQNQLLHYTK